jgi:hypothetical protein
VDRSLSVHIRTLLAQQFAEHCKPVPVQILFPEYVDPATGHLRPQYEDLPRLIGAIIAGLKISACKSSRRVLSNFPDWPDTTSGVFFLFNRMRVERGVLEIPNSHIDNLIALVLGELHLSSNWPVKSALARFVADSPEAEGNRLTKDGQPAHRNKSLPSHARLQQHVHP